MPKQIPYKGFTNKDPESKFENFTIDEARGWVINILLLIEKKIDERILGYYNPEHRHSFEKTVLNSSIIDFGKKLKILKNIGNLDNKAADSIRKLAAIRNGFAHAKISNSIIMNVDLRKEEPLQNIGTYSMIEVMNSNGKIIEKDAINYLKEFKEIFESSCIQDFINSNYS